MARINIDASAALAESVDLFRADQDQRLYFKLVDRAVCYLPMPERKPKLDFNEFLALANPEISAKLVDACAAAYLGTARAMRSVSPPASSKMLTNHAWRNGPMEEIHAGAFREYPLDQRRMTPAEERELMGFASERLALGMRICRRFSAATDRAPGPSKRALRIGRNVVDHAIWVDSHRVVAPDTPAERRIAGAVIGVLGRGGASEESAMGYRCVRDVIGCLDAHATCLDSSSRRQPHIFTPPLRIFH